MLSPLFSISEIEEKLPSAGQQAVILYLYPVEGSSMAVCPYSSILFTLSLSLTGCIANLLPGINLL
jgi:hypothetical protein